MPLSKPYPVLTFGALGTAVRVLQQALNLAPTTLPRLQDDGSFGPKTYGRVVEFQKQKQLVPDGVVGPVTWNQLNSFVQQVLQMIDQNAPVGADDATQRQRIVDVAQASFAQWGWGENGAVTPDGSARIAAAKGFGAAVAGRRARQGGAALAAIYVMAGAGGANCLTISTEIENLYQQNPADPVAKAKQRDTINQQDIGSWCGIFATYCYRASGLKISWDQVRTQSSAHFDVLPSSAAVQMGDIGVYDPQTNHHFVVIKDAAPGERVFSIDGNVGNPSESVVSPWNSVISKRFYLRTTLANKNGKFLRPKFAAMI